MEIKDAIGLIADDTMARFGTDISGAVFGRRPRTQWGLARWFGSLSASELRLLGEWGRNRRFDMAFMVGFSSAANKERKTIELDASGALDAAYGVGSAGYCESGSVAERQHLEVERAARNLACTLSDCQLRRYRWWPFHTPSRTAAELRLGEMIVLVAQVRRTPGCREIAAGLAPEWESSVEDLCACAAQLCGGG